MPDERIETYINRSGIQGDTAFMLENLNAINDAFNKVNGIKLTLGKDNSFKTATASAADLKKGVDNLGTSIESLKNIQADASKIIQQSASAYSGGSDAILKQAADLATLKLALQQNGALQKDYKKQLDDGTLSLQAYQEKTAAAIVTQKEYQASISSLNKDLSANVKQFAPSSPAPVGPAANLTIGEDDSENIKKTGEAVSDLDREQAKAAIDANEWAAAQKNGAAASEEAAAAQRIALSPLEQTAARLIEQRQALLLNTVAQEELNTQLSDGIITRDEWIAGTAKSILVENELKASVSELNKELALAAKADLATPGSIRDAQASNLQLISERSSITAQPGLATPEDLQRIAELNALIDKNNELIDANSSKLEKQKINIGNYPTQFKVAFGVLEDELGKVNAQLQTQGLGSKQIADLTLKQDALKNATALVGQEFSTTTAQTNAFKEAGKQVGQAYGTDSEVFKNFSTQVAAGTAENKKLGDALTENTAKGSGFKNALSSIFASLRQVAAAIPGIGLAGLIGLLLTPLASLASSLFDVNKKTVDLKDSQAVLEDQLKKTDEVLDGLGSSAGNGALEVDNLREHIDQAKQGLISQNDVVSLYNATIGKTTGAVYSLAEAEQGLIDNGVAYIKFTFLKAAAQEAATKASSEAVQAEIVRQKQLKDFGNVAADTRVQQFGGGSFNAADYDADTKRIEDAQKKRQAEQAKIHDDAANSYLAVEKTFLDQLNKLSADKGFNPDGDKIKEANEAAITSLDLQIEALTRYENKQNEVANTDTNTYDKRRQALLNYNAAAAKLVELNSLKSFVGVTNTSQQDQLAAKLITDQEKTAIDGYERLRTLDDSYYQRKVAAQAQAQQDQLQAQAKGEEDIFKNEDKSLKDRLGAYQKYVAAEAALNQSQYEQRLKAAGFTPQEIENYENGLEVQLQGKRITNDELIEATIAYNNKNAELTTGGARQVYEITTSWAKKTQQDIKDLNKLNQDNIDLSDTYRQDLDALSTSFQLQIIGVQQYQAKRKQLDKNFAYAQLQAQIDGYQKSLNADKTYENALNDQIQQASQALINAKESGNQDEIDENQARLDALKKAETKNAADILDINTKLENAKSALKQKKSDEEIAKQKELTDKEIELVRDVLNGAASIVDARYDNEKAQIQSTIDAITKKAQTDVDAENASADNAQDKADKIAVINQRAAAQEAQLAAQQKQIDIDKARFDKLKAISDIVINTAVAISKSLDKPYLIPVIAAIGAVEIATVAAQPLPTYKLGAGVDGRPKHPGGLAEVGHGKNELAITPDGEMIYTPSVPTVMNFPKDTVVLPDANAAINALIHSSFRGLEMPDSHPADSQLLRSNQQLTREVRRLQTIMSNKKEANLNVTWHGMEKAYRSGKNWMKYIDEKTNF